MIRDEAESLRIGAFSGFYGDSPENMGQLLKDGANVLIGDYLAELTMLILRKNQMRGGPGFARTFVEQLELNAADIAAGGVKVIANAGGLDPEGCAEEIRQMLRHQGVDLKVAAVLGDDLRQKLRSDTDSRIPLRNMDTGQVLDLEGREVLTANAYLGAWPVVDALRAGADIVVCPRLTDASLVVGPAAWYFDWSRESWDSLAGAVVAGHIIECGGQATGGNLSTFHEYSDLGIPGLPIAEIRTDGSCVISKVGDSGGVVNKDTVRAQLFYEISGHHYHNPDVVTDMSTVQVKDLGGDRVVVSSTRGLPPTNTTKLSLTYEGGYRNMMSIGITGGHVPEKVSWLRRQVEEMVGGPEHFDGMSWSVIGPSKEHGGDYDESTAIVSVRVRDREAWKVGRSAFANRIVQICLASIPGFYMTTPPQKEKLFGVQWPSLVDKDLIRPFVRMDGQEDHFVDWTESNSPTSTRYTPPADVAPRTDEASSLAGPTTRALLGSVASTRSGDKAGKANVGVWVDDPARYAWLRSYLTVERLGELMPEVKDLAIDRHDFDNLRGLNFVIYDYLDDGVSSSLRTDAQAKGVGEYLGNQWVDIPSVLLVGEQE